MKKSLILVLLFIAGVNPVNAQEWYTDIVAAQQVAGTKDLPIILVFKGSDWCAPCIKLDKEVFKTETFQLHAIDHFVLLEADFPKKKKNALPEALQNHNDALAEKYNKRGIFPLVVILDKNGKVLGETGYKKTTPAAFIKHLESFKG
jgi:thioredoxin-related protein